MEIVSDYDVDGDEVSVIGYDCNEIYADLVDQDR